MTIQHFKWCDHFALFKGFQVCLIIFTKFYVHSSLKVQVYLSVSKAVSYKKDEAIKAWRTKVIIIWIKIKSSWEQDLINSSFIQLRFAAGNEIRFSSVQPKQNKMAYTSVKRRGMALPLLKLNDFPQNQV